jgi:hypothetical protein
LLHHQRTKRKKILPFNFLDYFCACSNTSPSKEINPRTHNHPSLSLSLNIFPNTFTFFFFFRVTGEGLNIAIAATPCDRYRPSLLPASRFVYKYCSPPFTEFLPSDNTYHTFCCYFSNIRCVPREQAITKKTMKAQHQHRQKKSVEVFDPQFKFVKEIPASLVRHLPPARLNITRLVFCRNYVPGQLESCSMGDGCKFVHADVDPESLESHPIHVKYSWRHEDVCTYARLPAGEVLRVTAPNNRPPIEEIASERVLVTRGSLRFRNPEAVHHHCMHYHQHRMCNRGERCNFIHVVHVDPNVVGDFKRAPFSQSQSGRRRNSPHSFSDALSDQDADTFPEPNPHDALPLKERDHLAHVAVTNCSPSVALTANQPATRGCASSNISFSNIDCKRVQNSGSFVLTPGSVNNEVLLAAPIWPTSPTAAHIALDAVVIKRNSNGTISPIPPRFATNVDDNTRRLSASTDNDEPASIRSPIGCGYQMWYHHNPYPPRQTSKIVFEK